MPAKHHYQIKKSQMKPKFFSKVTTCNYPKMYVFTIDRHPSFFCKTAANNLLLKDDHTTYNIDEKFHKN